MGYLVGASDIEVDVGAEGGVINSMGAGVVDVIGAGVVVVTGASVGAASGTIGAGVGTEHDGEEQFPNITKDTVVFDPLACVQT